MHRITFALLPLLLFLLSTPTARAATTDYLGGQVSAVFLEDSGNSYDKLNLRLDSEYDTGLGLAAIFGKKYDNGFRVEGELGYRTNDVSEIKDATQSYAFDGDISVFSFLFNTFFDIRNPSPVTPYFGGGAGIALVLLDVNLAAFSIDDDTTVFAYQLGAGVGVDITPQFTLDLGYRYFATGDPRIEDEDGAKFKTEYDSHNLMAGFRVAF
ncbi:outer membrane channel protein [Desulfuromonas versatilis]|uniref:Outer membrane channel protein n=1 Tax=Desulfuromonas versatilis TaxID=2802975 RepID=A0ABM8HU50_9BACT|nr:outer membrane beta-barrel protein [Desulfuromonas versatilis]BCR04011.1 outer membrane channel protein [Desulfuromonas versatilis]